MNSSLPRYTYLCTAPGQKILLPGLGSTDIPALTSHKGVDPLMAEIVKQKIDPGSFDSLARKDVWLVDVYEIATETLEL